LSYRKDWKGMKFGHLLSDFNGSLRLMHGSVSGVCTAKEVKDLQREFPKAKVLEVAGAAHPVPFNAAVNKFVLQSLGLPEASAAKAEPTVALTQMEMAQMDMGLDAVPALPVTPVATDAPVAVLQSVEPPVVTAQPPSLWAWLKRQLPGTTKK
jgi:hypothetical protein